MQFLRRLRCQVTPIPLQRGALSTPTQDPIGRSPRTKQSAPQPLPAPDKGVGQPRSRRMLEGSDWAGEWDCGWGSQGWGWGCRTRGSGWGYGWLGGIHRLGDPGRASLFTSMPGKIPPVRRHRTMTPRHSTRAPTGARSVGQTTFGESLCTPIPNANCDQKCNAAASHLEPASCEGKSCLSQMLQTMTNTSAGEGEGSPPQ